MKRKIQDDDLLDDYIAEDNRPMEEAAEPGFLSGNKYMVIAALIGFVLLASAAAVVILPAVAGEGFSKDLFSKFSLSALAGGTPNLNTNKAGANTDGTGNTGTAVQKQKPALLSLLIKETPYTSSRTVTLSLYAKDADKCRYSNEDGTWSQYEPYSTETQWDLTGGDGQKTISYQCLNAAGESDVVSATTTLDGTQPDVSLSASLDGGLLSADMTASDSGSGGVACTLKLDSSELDSFGAGDYAKQYHVQLADGSHLLLLSCSDAVGNAAGAEAQLKVGQKNDTPKNDTRKTGRSITISINNGATDTDSRYVTLTLYAEGADVCRYKDESTAWTAYENYVTTRSWSFGGDSTGTKTVYYECKDKDNYLIGSVSDSINYNSRQYSGGGSGGSSGGGSPSCGANLTLCADNACHANCTGICSAGRFWCSNESICKLNGASCGGLVNLTMIAGTGLIPTVSSYLAGYTNNQNVVLEINASGANECHYRQTPALPAPDWSSWAAYAQQQPIVLSATVHGMLEDGQRLVEVECRNATGSSLVENSSIIYDSTAPVAADMTHPDITTLIYRQEIAGVNHTYVSISWAPTTDNVAGVNSYNASKYRIDPPPVYLQDFQTMENGSMMYELVDEVLENETYYYSFITYDNAGNFALSTQLVICDPSQPLPARCTNS